MFVIILIFSYIYISQGSYVKTQLWCGGSTLLQTVCRVCRWKNFENRSILAKIWAKVKCHVFLMDGVLSDSWASCDNYRDINIELSIGLFLNNK